MIGYSVEKEYQGMIDAYEKAGGDKSALQSKDVASTLFWLSTRIKYWLAMTLRG